jgi:hypothetical protein
MSDRLVKKARVRSKKSLTSAFICRDSSDLFVDVDPRLLAAMLILVCLAWDP